MKPEPMPTVDISDAELVSESLSGNRDAFGQIVERYQTLITSRAYCAIGDVNQSQDLAQETFVTAWKQLAELREPAKLRAWLCGITRFLICREFRRQGREPIFDAESTETLAEWKSPEPLPPDHAIHREELAMLWRALERIPVTYREPLVLFYREHQSVEAVAKGLGLSEETARQRLSRGRKFLQEEFMAFLATALDQTRPDKTFVSGVLAALPLVGATTKGATVGISLAKHATLAAKTAGSSGLLQGICNLFTGVCGWAAAVLPLGGYVGYKMAGDSRDSEHARRSVAAFWRIVGVSMFLLFCLPLTIMLLPAKLLRRVVTDVFWSKVPEYYLNGYLPIFMFGVVPLVSAIWLWQRRRRTVTDSAIRRSLSGQSSKSIALWVALAMISALAYLGFMSWLHSRQAPSQRVQIRYLSDAEIQSFVANPQVGKYRFELYQTATGARTLSGDLLQDRQMSPFVAPADANTIALLAAKGVSYDTKIEGKDFPLFHESHAAWWAARLLNPFCYFILVAGIVTLLGGRYRRSSGQLKTVRSGNNRHVDRAFAALAAGAMVALAVYWGITTNWSVRHVGADQVPAIVARHGTARFEVFLYPDGSKKLWISDRHAPDFIAPANESTVESLARQGINCPTYVAGNGGMAGAAQLTTGLWMFALTAVAAGLIWWVLKTRPESHPDFPTARTQ